MLCEPVSALAFHSVLHFCLRNSIPFFASDKRTSNRLVCVISSSVSCCEKSMGTGSQPGVASTQRGRLSWTCTGGGGARACVCGAGQGLPLCGDGVSGKVGVKSTRTETGGGTLLDFFKVGVPQGHVSRLSCQSASSSLTSSHQRDIVEITACLMAHR